MYLLRTIARALHIDYKAPYDAHKYATVFGGHKSQTRLSAATTASTAIPTKPWEQPRSFLYGAPQKAPVPEPTGRSIETNAPATTTAPPRTYPPGTWLVTSEHGAVSGAQRQLAHDRPDTMETDPVYAMSLQAHGAPYASMVHPPESNADHMETSGVMMNPYTTETYQLFEEALPPPNRTRGGTNAADRTAMRMRLDTANGGAAAVTRRAKKEVIQEWNDEDAGVPTAVTQAQIERTTLQRREMQNKQALFGNFNDDCPGSPQMSRHPLPPILVEPPLIATNALDKETFQLQNHDVLNYGQGRPFKPGMRLRHETLLRADEQLQGPGLAQESTVGPYNTLSTAYGDVSTPAMGFSGLKGALQTLEPPTVSGGTGAMTAGLQVAGTRGREAQRPTAELDPFLGTTGENAHLSRHTTLVPNNLWTSSAAHLALPEGTQPHSATQTTTAAQMKDAVAYGDVGHAPITAFEKVARVVAETWTSSAKRQPTTGGPTLTAHEMTTKSTHAAPVRTQEAEVSHRRHAPLLEGATHLRATLVPNLPAGLQSLLAMTEPPTQKYTGEFITPASHSLWGSVQNEALFTTQMSTQTQKTVRIGHMPGQATLSTPTQNTVSWVAQGTHRNTETPPQSRSSLLPPSSMFGSCQLTTVDQNQIAHDTASRTRATPIQERHAKAPQRIASTTVEPDTASHMYGGPPPSTTTFNTDYHIHPGAMNLASNPNVERSFLPQHSNLQPTVKAHRGEMVTMTSRLNDEQTLQNTTCPNTQMSIGGGAAPGGQNRTGKHNAPESARPFHETSYGSTMPAPSGLDKTQTLTSMLDLDRKQVLETPDGPAVLAPSASGDAQALTSVQDLTGMHMSRSKESNMPAHVNVASHGASLSLLPSSMLDVPTHGQHLATGMTVTTSSVDDGVYLGVTTQTSLCSNAQPLALVPLGYTSSNHSQESRIRNALQSLPSSTEMSQNMGLSQADTVGGHRTQINDAATERQKQENSYTHGSKLTTSSDTRTTKVQRNNHETVVPHLGMVGTPGLINESTMTKTTQHHTRAKSTPLLIEGLQQAPSILPMQPPVTIKDTTKMMEKQRGRSPAPLPLTAGSTSLTSQPHVPRLHGFQESSQTISADLTVLQRMVPEPPSFLQNTQTLPQQALVSSKKHKLRSRSPLTSQVPRTVTRHMSVGEGRRLHERSESRTTEV